MDAAFLKNEAVDVSHAFEEYRFVCTSSNVSLVSLNARTAQPLAFIQHQHLEL